jgi:hypothetical protein
MAAHRKYAPKDAVEVTERLAAQGHSIVGIAKQLGVTRETFKRWCDEDAALQEAFEIGRETERQALHALIVQSAVLNKPANVNAFFILKARHGYRENDAPNTKVDVAVAVSPVMVVRDHGTDEEWAAKAQEQQRKLMQSARMPIAPQLEAPQEPAQPSFGPPAWSSQAASVYEPPAPSYAPPVWKARA